MKVLLNQIEVFFFDFFFFFFFGFFFWFRPLIDSNNSLIVVETFPFEAEETGWGEFEIAIKIFFQDTSEKPVTLYHHLRLYPSDEAMQDSKMIVAETYDEIVIFFVLFFYKKKS